MRLSSPFRLLSKFSQYVEKRTQYTTPKSTQSIFIGGLTLGACGGFAYGLSTNKQSELHLDFGQSKTATNRSPLTSKPIALNPVVQEFNDNYQKYVECCHFLEKLKVNYNADIASFFGSSREITADEFNELVDKVVAHYDSKYQLESVKPQLILINGGLGKPNSTMSIVQDVAIKLRNKGFKVAEFRIDITGGFKNEQKTVGSVSFDHVINHGLSGNEIVADRFRFDFRQNMVQQGDVIFVCPGGLGTQYEFYQTATAEQLGPRGIDIYGYSQPQTFKKRFIFVSSKQSNHSDTIHLMKEMVSKNAIDQKDFEKISII